MNEEFKEMLKRFSNDPIIQTTYWTIIVFYYRIFIALFVFAHLIQMMAHFELNGNYE